MSYDESLPPYIPRAPHTRIEPEFHPIEEAIALDDDGAPVRLRSWCAHCFAQVWAGYHDFAGGAWRVRWFAGEAADAPEIEECAECGRSFDARPLTLAELAEELRRIRAGLAPGAPLTARIVAAMNAEMDLGEDFERVAALYGGREPDELQAALRAWLLPPQPNAPPSCHEVSI